MLAGVMSFLLCLLQVTGVLQVDDDSTLRFSMDTVFFTEKYEIV